MCCLFLSMIYKVYIIIRSIQKKMCHIIWCAFNSRLAAHAYLSYGVKLQLHLECVLHCFNILVWMCVCLCVCMCLSV